MNKIEKLTKEELLSLKVKCCLIPLNCLKHMITPHLQRVYSCHGYKHLGNFIGLYIWGFYGFRGSAEEIDALMEPFHIKNARNLYDVFVLLLPEEREKVAQKHFPDEASVFRFLEELGVSPE